MPDADLPQSRPDDARHALFLDFDGTLVAIAPRPQDVVVEPGLPAVLHRLRAQLGGALAIVTGRPASVIDAHVAPHRLDVAGLHGAELRVAGTMLEAAPPPTAFRDAVDRLSLAAGEGIIVEDKGRSVALHWRLAPARGDEARALIDREAARLGPGWRLQEGKCVLELLPAAADKGAAIAALMAREPYRGRSPVFIGDDVTDEDGFAVVEQAGGVAIRVGEGASRARRRISDPAALLVFLRRWAETGAPPFPETDR